MRLHSAVYLAGAEDSFRCTLSDVAVLITNEKLLKLSPFVLTSQPIKRTAEVERGEEAQSQTSGKRS